MQQVRASRHAERLGGGLMILVGAAVVFMMREVHIGNLANMGPGFLPSVLGTLLLLLGGALCLVPRARGQADVGEAAPVAAPRAPVWRGPLCILAGVLAFVVLGAHFGLVAAAFASVFVAALGDRDNTLRDAGGLALLVTLFGVAVFHFGLKLQLPLFSWH